MSTPFIQVKPSLLSAQRVEVASAGELVTITVGNATLRMHYRDAFKLSQWIRLRAKESKRRAGDTSWHWSALGTLSGE